MNVLQAGNRDSRYLLSYHIPVLPYSFRYRRYRDTYSSVTLSFMIPAIAATTRTPVDRTQDQPGL
jgi:hypothetical protein